MENVGRFFVSVETSVYSADTENSFRTKSNPTNPHLHRNVVATLWFLQAYLLPWICILANRFLAIDYSGFQASY
jgi:hypothetical protein